jgi:hypothetical protein
VKIYGARPPIPVIEQSGDASCCDSARFSRAVAENARICMYDNNMLVTFRVFEGAACVVGIRHQSARVVIMGVDPVHHNNRFDAIKRRIQARPVVFGLATFFVSSIMLNTLLGPATCRDGFASHSIGLSGACSHHGGVARGKRILSTLGSTVAGFLVWGWAEKQNEGQKVKPDQLLTKDSPKCPNCGAPMRERCHDGMRFWGCPIENCRGIRRYI